MLRCEWPGSHRRCQGQNGNTDRYRGVEDDQREEQRCGEDSAFMQAEEIR